MEPRKLAYRWVAQRLAHALEIQGHELDDEVVRVEVVKILKAFENAADIPPIADVQGGNGVDKNGHP